MNRSLLRGLCCGAFCLWVVGCGADAGGSSSSSSAAAATSGASSSKPASNKSSAPAASSSATGPASAAAPAAGNDLALIGGADWKAVFVGAPPTALTESFSGGQGTGMADDYTIKSTHPAPPWKFNNAGGGGVYWAPSKKAVAVDNINLKMDATTKAVDTWIKSALVSDVKHLSEGEVIDVGPDKIPLKAGHGTAKMKSGEVADFYWWDIYSTGDFSHKLRMVIIAKEAPDEDKKVALSILRQITFTPKAKPHYKKP